MSNISAAVDERHDVVNADWLDFMTPLIQGETSQRAISARTGIDQGTISRWLTGSAMPSVRAAVMFARGYNVNAVDALIAAGYLTDEDARRISATALDARRMSTTALLDELARRSR